MPCGRFSRENCPCELRGPQPPFYGPPGWGHHGHGQHGPPCHGPPRHHGWSGHHGHHGHHGPHGHHGHHGHHGPYGHHGPLGFGPHRFFGPWARHGHDRPGCGREEYGRGEWFWRGSEHRRGKGCSRKNKDNEEETVLVRGVVIERETRPHSV